MTTATKLVRLALGSILMVLLLADPASCAGDMLRDVEWVRPRIGQRGTKVEVIIQGKFIEDPKELVFYKPGIRALSLEMIEPLKQPIGLAHGGRIEEQVKAILEIDSDCQPGEHPFRLRTATGLSLLATFHVSPFPVINETTSSNDTIATAQSVPINTTVNATVDTDMYQVAVTPGSRFSAEVDCVRIADHHYGDSEFDLALKVLDATGRELASNDENALHVQDPLVSFLVPENLPDGKLYIEVRQSVHSPRDIPYAIHLGDFQRPMAIYPAGGKQGESLSATLLGDPKGAFADAITLPTESSSIEWFGNAPSGISVRSCTFGNVLENTLAEVTPVEQLPIALNGLIESAGDTDRFRVHVSKGDRYRVRVYASSLGFPIDPAIRIMPVDAQGNLQAPEVDVDDADPRTLNDRDLFGTSIRSGGGVKDVLDPSVIWEPKLDGEYIVEIRDTNNSGGETSVYRVEIEVPPPSVHPVLMSRFFDWVEGSRGTGLAVPQGNRWTVLVSLPKGQGSNDSGPYELLAKGLPEGVQMICPQVPGQASVWPVQLVAAADALPKAKVFDLQASSKDPAIRLATGCQQAVPFINHSGGDAWRILRVDRFAMAVTEPAPFSIELVQPTVSLVRGGELFITVNLVRKEGFDEPIEFQADFGPPGVSLPPKDVIEAGKSQSVLRIAASKNAAIGQGWLYVIASTMGGSDYLGPGRIRVSSQLIKIDVAEPFVELASEPTSIRRGAKGNIVFSVQSKSPFDGQAKVQLLGLPKGLQIAGPLPVITKDAKEIAFQIEATDEALLGPVAGLECELIVQVAGQEIRQRAGNATIRIDPRL
ncbi:MAG: serine protease [Pirellula sp.]